jgi:hypothetical protein
MDSDACKLPSAESFLAKLKWKWQNHSNEKLTIEQLLLIRKEIEKAHNLPIRFALDLEMTFETKCRLLDAGYCIYQSKYDFIDCCTYYWIGPNKCTD